MGAGLSCDNRGTLRGFVIRCTGIAGCWTANRRRRDNKLELNLRLPPEVRALFWEYGDREVSLESERDFVMGRVLSAADWDGLRWLRREVGEAAIRDYLDRTRGRLLSPRQLRLWQVLLGLPEETVTAWIGNERRRLWDRRAG